jgi:cysteine desulfurase / selenocysteine lyase
MTGKRAATKSAESGIGAAIRQDFPILVRRVKGKPLVYLDNAATSQKPRQVIDALSSFYENHNANVHRSLHTLGEEADSLYESARAKTASFVGAATKEIIFTRNTTESINLVARTLPFKKGDEIVTTIMEHHSNIVPWQNLGGVKMKFADIDGDGRLSMAELEKMITKKTRLVAITQASNVLGTINDVKSIAKLAHDNGSLLLVDGAQSAPHMPVDVRSLDCDFFAFSAHKMLGPTGVGVLYGRKDLLDSMPPFMMGGDMIKEVYKDHTVFSDLPAKFEGGTPNIADVVAFGAALDYLSAIGMKNVQKHEHHISTYVIDKLAAMDGLTLHGPKDAEGRTATFSFTLNGVHPHDIASLLDDDGIAIRSGHACAMPLIQRLGVNSIARASFYIYNTKEEADALTAALERVKRVFKV